MINDIQIKTKFRNTEEGNEDWKILTVGDLVKFSGGSQPPRYTFRFEPKTGYIRLIQIRDYKTNDYITYIPEILAKKVCTEKDIMIGRYGPPIFQILRGIRGAYNVALIKAIPNNELEQEYLYYFLKQEKLFKFIEKLSQRSSGQTGVDLVALRNFVFPLPSKTEQLAIASVLLDLDSIIQKLEKLIVKKHAIKQGTMQQLLTGKKRLTGYIKPWKEINLIDSSILKARIGWQGLTTAEYLTSGEYYLVTGTDFENGRINWDKCCYVKRERYVQDKNIQLKARDILLTKDGTIGKVSYVDVLPGPTTLNSGVFVIRPKNGTYIPLFLYYILSSNIFDNFLTKLQAGSTISHLYQKDFINFSFMAPDIKEQEAISQILLDMDKELEILEKKLDKYNQLKQGAMQVLLTGKVRLVKN